MRVERVDKELLKQLGYLTDLEIKWGAGKHQSRIESSENMPVYIRTAAGNEAALNPKSALPRKLRTLLISVDGRTRLGTYVSSLSSFGDVEALIQSLQHAGLIEEQAPQKTVGDSWPEKNNNETFGEAGRFASQTNVKSAWSQTDVGSTAWGASPALSRSPLNEPVDDLASWSKFQPQPTPQAFKPAGAQPATTAHYQLRNAISLMSDFVSQHMPMESLELVLALEGQTSVEQVVSSLKGYESVISHLGEPARQHLAELRRLLSSN